MKKSFAQWGIENFGEDFLDKYWNWEKNNEIGINPYKIGYGSHKKVWLYCLKHDYHNYDREGNKVGYEIRCDCFINGSRCGYCGNLKTHWRDSLAYNYPNIAKMIAIPENNLTFEDCYVISCHNLRKFYFKCLDCGNVSKNKKILNDVVKRNFSCNICSDGISIPNKFMSNILNQLNIDFITELSSKKFSGKNYFYYDFYLPKYNMIIEINGLQHYEIKHKGRTLEEEQMNDLFKYKCAKNYVDNYIVIDCRYSELEWMKENIIKELSSYFNLNNIDWELAWKESQKSKCIESWELWDKGLSVFEISNILKLDRHTVSSYLKKRKNSDYNYKTSNKRGANLRRKNK